MKHHDFVRRTCCLQEKERHFTPHPFTLVPLAQIILPPHFSTSLHTTPTTCKETPLDVPEPSSRQDAWSVLRVEQDLSLYTIFDGHGPHGLSASTRPPAPTVLGSGASPSGYARLSPSVAEATTWRTSPRTCCRGCWRRIRGYGPLAPRSERRTTAETFAFARKVWEGGKRPHAAPPRGVLVFFSFFWSTSWKLAQGEGTRPELENLQLKTGVSEHVEASSS